MEGKAPLPSAAVHIARRLSQIPVDHKSPPSNEPDRAAALQRLVDALESGDANEDDAELDALDRFLQIGATPVDPSARAVAAADAIVRSLNGPELDLSGLESTYVDSLSRLPPEGWQALHEYAIAAGTSITTLVLPKSFYSDHLWGCQLEGLAKLNTVGHISMHAPTDEKLDLRVLQGLSSLHLQGAIAPAAVIVSPNVSVGHPAVPADGVASVHRKCVVLSLDEHGHPIRRETLHDMIYQRTAREDEVAEAWSSEEDDDSLEDKQAHARGIALNRSAKFGDGERIVCRHLAAHWLEKRAAHHRDALQAVQEGRQPAAFSYGKFIDRQKLTSSVSEGVKQSCESMEAAGALACFEQGAFGKVLCDRFAAMSPGQTAHFAIATPNHMLGVELRVKQPKDEHGSPMFVVNLYDPNTTASHKRLVVSDLKELQKLPLSQWMGPERINRYFGKDEANIGMLYAWPPTEARRVQDLDVYVPPSLRDSKAFLFAVLRDGDVKNINAAVQQIIGGAGALDKVDRLLANVANMDGMGWACQLDREKGIQAFLNAVLEAPEASLSMADKASVCGAFLASAIDHGTPRSAEIVTRSVLAAPSPLFTDGQRADILLAREKGVPILHRIACDMTQKAMRLDSQPTRERAIEAHFKAILNSSLPAQQKEALCASAFERRTAAQAASENGNHGVAKAMVRAVLGAFTEQGDRDFWLRHLKVPHEFVNSVIEEWALATPAQPAGDGPAKRSIEDAMRARFKRLFETNPKVEPRKGTEQLRRECRNAELRISALEEVGGGLTGNAVCWSTRPIAGWITQNPDGKQSTSGLYYYKIPFASLGKLRPLRAPPPTPSPTSLPRQSSRPVELRGL